jgi:hypothetical protein
MNTRIVTGKYLSLYVGLLYNKTIIERIKPRSEKKMLPFLLKKPSIVVPVRLTTKKLGKEKLIRVPTNGH